MDSVAPRHVESFWTGDQTHVPFTGRRILNHWTTSEVFHTFDHFLNCFVEQWILLYFKIFPLNCEKQAEFYFRVCFGTRLGDFSFLLVISDYPYIYQHSLLIQEYISFWAEYI